MSFGRLRLLANRVAAGPSSMLGLAPGNAVGICAPMTPEAVAVYLGIVKAGCLVVSVAESFAAGEVATRFRVGTATAAFAQDVHHWGSRALPLYDRVREAGPPGGSPRRPLPQRLRRRPRLHVDRPGRRRPPGATA